MQTSCTLELFTSTLFRRLSCRKCRGISSSATLKEILFSSSIFFSPFRVGPFCLQNQLTTTQPTSPHSLPPPHSSTFTLFPHGAKTWEIEGYTHPCVVRAQRAHEIGINYVRVYAKLKQDVDIPVYFFVLGFF